MLHGLRASRSVRHEFTVGDGDDLSCAEGSGCCAGRSGGDGCQWMERPSLCVGTCGAAADGALARVADVGCEQRGLRGEFALTGRVLWAIGGLASSSARRAWVWQRAL